MPVVPNRPFPMTSSISSKVTLSSWRIVVVDVGVAAASNMCEPKQMPDLVKMGPELSWWNRELSFRS